MTTPRTPSLADLGRIIADNVPVLQWLEGLQTAVATAVAQETAAVLGGSPMDEAKARVVAWRALTAIGQYVKDVPTEAEPQAADAAAEMFG